MRLVPAILIVEMCQCVALPAGAASLTLPAVQRPGEIVHIAGQETAAAQQIVFQRVSAIVAEMLGAVPEDILPGSSLVADLGADELDLVELVMAVEEEFGVAIEDEQVDGVVTVGDLAALVASLQPSD